MGIILELEDSEFSGYIDDGEIYAAQLVNITQKLKPFKADDGSDIYKLEFKFRLSADDGHDGDDIWGDTGVKLINHPGCRLTAWATTLLGRDLVKGQRLDTDDLLDRPCRVVIGKREYADKATGMQKTHNFVRDILPTRAAMVSLAAGANRSSVDDNNDEPFIVPAAEWWPEVGLGQPPDRMLS